jgi:uncharacterized protein with PQ loop repeat
MQFCQFLPSVCADLTHNPYSPPNPSHPSLPLPPRLLRIGDVINDANARTAHAHEDKLQKRRCKCCAQEEGEGESRKEECAFHAGTWGGYLSFLFLLNLFFTCFIFLFSSLIKVRYTYTQVQEWRYNVWRRRLHKGVKCVIHYPIEIAKSTTALGTLLLNFYIIFYIYNF